MSGEEVLSVDDLRVSFPARNGSGANFNAVDGVSLSLARGETLGIVGESGSGKTMLALSAMGLVPKPGRITSGSITLRNRRIDDLGERDLCDLRGREIGMVFQDPMTSLNPVRRVGALLVEAIRRHNKVGKDEARCRALDALRAVGIPSPEARLRAYPHELSGGLRQRVMIALALVNHPPVIIADEPTTALDTTIQAQILGLLRERLSDAALILITHDLGVAAELCDRIAVMYYGRIVEAGSAESILSRPRHPYTAGLLAAVPNFDFGRPTLVPIPGAPPDPSTPVNGCAFQERCQRRTPICATKPLLREHTGGLVACAHPAEEETIHA